MRYLISLLLLSYTIIPLKSSSQLSCPVFSSGNLGNGGAAGTLPFTNPTGFGKSGNFTFSNATNLNITAAFINGSQVQTSSGITSGSNFYFTHLQSNNITYYSDLNGNSANLRAGTYAFTFTNGTSTATCSYTIAVSGSTFSVVSLNAGYIGSDQSICSGTSPSSLSLTTPVSGGTSPYTYKWQVSSDGSSFSDVSSGGTSTSYSPGTHTATRYYQLRVTDNNSNIATSNKITISVNGTAGVWQGSSNTDFNNSANWCGTTLPSSSTNVIIGSKANKPVVTSNITVNSVTIEDGGSLGFSGGVLTATNGITVNPGGAIIGSGSNISGTVTIVQNFNGQRGWRILSHPFSTSRQFASIASDNQISIETTGSSNAAGISDVRSFSSSSGSWSDAGTSVLANTPYALFFRGTNSEVTKNTYSGGPSTILYKVSGTMNGNSISITPANTSNFAIVGNPYAAPVNTQALTAGVSTAYYTYQVSRSSSQSGQRTRAGSWVVSGSNSSNTTTIPILGVIAFVPSSTSSYNISTSAINNSGTLLTNIFSENRPFKQMELLLQNSIGDYADKLFVRLDPDADARANDLTDFRKYYNEVNNLYTLSEDKIRLAIDARKKLDVIQLAVSAPIGKYEFKIGENSLPYNCPVYLKDNFTNTEFELNSKSTYSFSITADAASKGENRFELMFGTKTSAITPDSENADFKADLLSNVVSGNTVVLTVSGLKNNKGTARLIDSNGQILKTIMIANGLQYLDLGSKPRGLNFLNISNGNSVIVKKIINLQ